MAENSLPRLANLAKTPVLMGVVHCLMAEGWPSSAESLTVTTGGGDAASEGDATKRREINIYQIKSSHHDSGSAALGFCISAVQGLGAA